MARARKVSRIPEGLQLHGPVLGHYYHDFRYELSIPRPVDGRGMPLFDYGSPVGERYHPVLLTAYSLALHEQLLSTNDARSRERFLQLADFLVEMQKRSRSGWAWEFDVPNLKYYVAAPWVSGMSQGMGISALLRAYQLTGSDRYLQSSAKALTSFELPVPEGGVREKDADGNVFFEEVPSTSPGGSTHILNGFFFALWGIYDLLRVTQSQRARRLFADGISTLEAVVSRYDTGYWTLYHLGARGYLADRFYHGLHVDGLKIFHSITADPLFETYALKWDSYSKSWRSLARWSVAFPTYRLLYKIRRLMTLGRSI